jgi:hypothetical protein
LILIDGIWNARKTVIASTSNMINHLIFNINLDTLSISGIFYASDSKAAKIPFFGHLSKNKELLLLK